MHGFGRICQSASCLGNVTPPGAELVLLRWARSLWGCLQTLPEGAELVLAEKISVLLRLARFLWGCLRVLPEGEKVGEPESGLARESGTSNWYVELPNSPSQYPKDFLPSKPQSPYLQPDFLTFSSPNLRSTLHRPVVRNYCEILFSQCLV
jgi:hypothetical protein